MDAKKEIGIKENGVKFGGNLLIRDCSGYLIFRTKRSGAGGPGLHGCGLRDFDVTRLLALLAVNDVELDFVTFVQGAKLVAFSDDRGEVDEHVLCPLFLRGNKSIAFLAVEPLYSTVDHKTSLLTSCIVFYRYQY